MSSFLQGRVPGMSAFRETNHMVGILQHYYEHLSAITPLTAAPVELWGSEGPRLDLFPVLSDSTFLGQKRP